MVDDIKSLISTLTRISNHTAKESSSAELKQQLTVLNTQLEHLATKCETIEEQKTTMLPMHILDSVNANKDPLIELHDFLRSLVDVQQKNQGRAQDFDDLHRKLSKSLLLEDVLL